MTSNSNATIVANSSAATRNDNVLASAASLATPVVGSASATTTASAAVAAADSTESDSAYSKVGLAMWLNNQPDQAEQHFKARLHRTPIFAGYAFIVSMNGVIAYEMDRIEQAQRLLKDLERRCHNVAPTPATPATTPADSQTTPSPGWFATIRTRLFGSNQTLPPPSVVVHQPMCAAAERTRHIEEQIILADAYLSSAILTFLTQDVTGLMRGSWLLRKAWKIYQSTYAQLYEMFMLLHGEQYNVPPMPSNYHKTNMPRSKSDINYSTRFPSAGQTPAHFPPSDTSTSNISPTETHSNIHHPTRIQPTQSLQHLTAITPPSNALSLRNSPAVESPNNVRPQSSSTARNRPTHLALSYVTTSSLTEAMQQSNKSATGRNSRLHPQTCSTEMPSSGFPQWPTSSRRRSNLLYMSTEVNNIETADVHRLMGAVSFGYGIFQLSASLLPLSLLRIISFFGFEGNRERGIDCLMYARLSDDMRAPMATLALLWFYTFGSQMLKYEDGYTNNQARAAASLINENELSFPSAAIFLFFRGRVERMQANSQAAERAYQRAFNVSAQKELRLLCMHEIAWCKLIQLDFNGAQQRFNELRHVSVFSKAFYTYMTAICQAASGNCGQLASYCNEITTLLAHNPKQRDSHIGQFVLHRLPLFPETTAADGGSGKTNQFYWKYLVYEVLFLWSALGSASRDELTAIVADCSAPSGRFVEPIVGVQQLILGGALATLKQYQAAVNAYRMCVRQREADGAVEFQHISAFARYELGMLLLQCSTDCSHEARELFKEALTYKGYDLENRLVVHLQKEYRKLG